MNIWKHREQIGLALLALLAFTGLTLAMALAFMDKPTGGALCGALGLLLLAFLQLSRFKAFKGLGFEAELWEDKQKEAAELVERTRDLLGVLSTTMLTAAPRLGRLGTAFSRRELLDLAQEVEQLLVEAGAPEASNPRLRGEIDRLISWDLARETTGTLGKEIRQRAEQLRAEISQRFGSPISDAEGFGRELERVRTLQACTIDPKDLDPLNRGQWAADISARITALPEFTEAEKASLRNQVNDSLLDLEAWTNGRNVRRPETFFNPRPRE
ncbi:hypothetical protein [Phenylobacterium koreense]|uniref:Uncharacterized protein n=1 Tax=Phenylobacterium koreense TaxID=266125 RepID=A0ABV2EJH0_9CAUL